MISAAIIGAQKCATSSIGQAFNDHPKIAIHSQREMSFFIDDETYKHGWDAKKKRYFKKDESRILLIKNVGLMYQPRGIERLAEHNPDMQIVISLRDPVKRAVSAYEFFRMQGKEHSSTFKEALDLAQGKGNSGFDYLGRGDYYPQIKSVFEKFPKEQVTIILTEDLVENSELIFKKLDNTFCGTSTHGWSPNLNRNNSARTARFQSVSKFTSSNFAGRKIIRTMVPAKLRDAMRSKVEKLNSKQSASRGHDEAVISELKTFYSPKIRQLSELIDRDLSHWAK